MVLQTGHVTYWSCRSPSGERGLKSHGQPAMQSGLEVVSPSGERGLKFSGAMEKVNGIQVAPHPGSVDWNTVWPRP